MALGVGASVSQVNANADDSWNSIKNYAINSAKKTNAMGAKADEENGAANETRVDPTKDLENAEKQDREQKQQERESEEKEEDQPSNVVNTDTNTPNALPMHHKSKSEYFKNQIETLKHYGVYNIMHDHWQREGLTDEQGILGAKAGSSNHHVKQANNNRPNKSNKVNQHLHKHLRKFHHKTYPLTPKNIRGYWYRINHHTNPTTFDTIEVHNRNIEWGDFDDLETFNKHPLYKSKGSKNIYHFTEFDIRYTVKKQGPYLFLNTSKFRRINLKKVAHKYGSSLSKLKYYARRTGLSTQKFATFVILLKENPSKVSDRINNDDF